MCEYAFRRKYAVDNTGDIAIPDEVVDLKLLLECRHERNVLQKICAERSDEIERLRAEVEALRKLLKEWREHADYGGVPSEECLDATDATLYREGEK